MSKALGQGCERQRANGLWESVFYVEQSDGSRKRCSVYGRTKSEAVAKKKAATRRADDGLPAIEGRETLGAFLERWLRDVISRRSPQTHRSYEQAVRVHLRPALGKLLLRNLAASHVDSYTRAKLEGEGEEHAGALAPTVVHVHRAILRSALGYAERKGLVARNVVRLSEPISLRTPEVVPITPEQAGRFLEKARGHKYEAIFVLAILTGLRSGELLGLTRPAIDLEERVLHVRTNLQRVRKGPKAWAFELLPVKTRKGVRAVGLPALAVEVLRAHLARQAARPVVKLDPWQLVFTDSDGEPLSNQRVGVALHEIQRAAGLPTSGHFHSLRHAAISYLLAQGRSLLEVSDIAGHSSVGVTGDVYGHLLPAARREAADSLDALFPAREKPSRR